MLPYHNVFVVLIALRHVGSIQTSKFIFQSFYNTYSKKNPKTKKQKQTKQNPNQPKRKKQTNKKPTKKQNKKRRRKAAHLVRTYIIVIWLFWRGKPVSSYQGHWLVVLLFPSSLSKPIKTLLIMWSLSYFNEFIINYVCPRVTVVRKGVSPSNWLKTHWLHPKWGFSCNYPWLQLCYTTRFHWMLVCKIIMCQATNPPCSEGTECSHGTCCEIIGDSLA